MEHSTHDWFTQFFPESEKRDVDPYVYPSVAAASESATTNTAKMLHTNMYANQVHTMSNHFWPAASCESPAAQDLEASPAGTYDYRAHDVTQPHESVPKPESLEHDQTS